MSVKSTEDEFVPQGWEGDKQRVDPATAPPEGWYIWAVRVMGVDFYDAKTDKPYAELKLTVEETEARPSAFAGFTFTYRLYINPKAEGWARWMLRKFEYPEELLKEKAPVLSKKKLIGLSGEMLVEVAVNQTNNYLAFDGKGFQRNGEKELDKKLPENAERESGDEAEGPTVDINADDAGTTEDVNAQLSDLD
jgi:hypothetical protein